MDLSIIIVNWNATDFLEKCLSSIYDYTKGISFEIIVIDNASQHSPRQMMEQKLKEVFFTENKENMGFAKAVNQGLKKGKGRYILLLNPDTCLLENSFLKMIEFLEKDSAIGILGPKMLHSDKTLQTSLRRFPTLLSVIFEELLTEKWIAYLPSRYRWKMISKEHDQTKEVDQIMGSCFLIRKEVLEKIGFFAEQFFVYFEEVDFCMRAKQKNVKIYFFDQTSVMHQGNVSNRVAPYSSLKERYRSLYAFFRKYKRVSSVWGLKFFIGIGFLEKMLVSICFNLFSSLKDEHKIIYSPLVYGKLFLTHWSL